MSAPSPGGAAAAGAAGRQARRARPRARGGGERPEGAEWRLWRGSGGVARGARPVGWRQRRRRRPGPSEPKRPSLPPRQLRAAVGFETLLRRQRRAAPCRPQVAIGGGSGSGLSEQRLYRGRGGGAGAARQRLAVPVAGVALALMSLPPRRLPRCSLPASLSLSLVLVSRAAPRWPPPRRRGHRIRTPSPAGAGARRSSPGGRRRRCCRGWTTAWSSTSTGCRACSRRTASCGSGSPSERRCPGTRSPAWRRSTRPGWPKTAGCWMKCPGSEPSCRSTCAGAATITTSCWRGERGRGWGDTRVRVSTARGRPAATSGLSEWAGGRRCPLLPGWSGDLALAAGAHRSGERVLRPKRCWRNFARVHLCLTETGGLWGRSQDDTSLRRWLCL